MVIHESIYNRLKEVARAGKTVNYTYIAELANFNIAILANRKNIGRYLDYINQFEYVHGRPLLSAVVIREGRHLPGRGFFDLARQLGVCNGKTDAEFFAEELKRVHEYWKNCPYPDEGCHKTGH